MSSLIYRILIAFSFTVLVTGCPLLGDKTDKEGNPVPKKGRDVFFVGVDISGSFMGSAYFKDSIRFLSHYIYAHLKGSGGLSVPGNLFVGSIGGAKANEPKTFYPIQTFQHRNIKEIERKLIQIFPRRQANQFTDYNAFFKQISVFVRNKKLVLKPITIVMLTDGIPDAPKKNGKHDYRSIKLKSLETLARDITLRVLYTSAVVGMNWQTKVPRQRVKIWTQDANVMRDWKDRHTLLPGKPFDQQTRFFSWMKDNVDFNVPRKRVN